MYAILLFRPYLRAWNEITHTITGDNQNVQDKYNILNKRTRESIDTHTCITLVQMLIHLTEKMFGVYKETGEH